jgi:hypothetical protein
MIDVIDNESIAGVLAVADADFDRLENRLFASPNLVYTDCHDLETTIASMGALRKVLAEFGSPSRIADFERKRSEPVELALGKLTAELGRYRWLNAICPEPRSMDWFGARRYVNDSLSIDRDRLHKDAVGNGLGVSEEILLADLAKLPLTASIWDIAQGHDLVDVITLALKGPLGKLPGNRGQKDIAAALRLAAETAQLQRSSMWQGILAWQERAQPYFILPDARDIRC